ncbi:MAG: DNA helicase RecQ [Ileibacterium sp.]|nr:DNA helicase RecQ [Ileibacterium sp.]
MDQALSLLKKYYGYDSFRKGQASLIEALAIRKRDVVAVMPTGAGKSICYQIPALMMDGITLVISPLMSLMHDQVASLKEAGIPAAYFDSSLSWPQYRKALQLARQGAYKIIYVAPERLLTDIFLDFAKSVSISFVAVDEAHCVSQWGQNFRPAYRDIPEFLAQLPVRPRYGAYTATATVAVLKDIMNWLKLDHPARLITGFDRPNLFFEVQKPKDKKQALLKFLSTRKDECGIIYCQTRKECEEVSDLLQSREFLSAPYHAGLSDEQRSKTQDDFIYDRISVICATNAFGMGIDKSNVRYVVHYSLPHSIENYYQEAGRAGRDGEDSHCLLLYSPADVMTARFIIEHSGEDDLEAANSPERMEAIQRDLAKLRRMVEYCTTRGCLRSSILHYFAQKAQPSCGSCSNCLRKWDELDVTTAAKHVFTLMTSLPCSYGIKMTVDLLKGSRTEKIRSSRLNQVKGYGNLEQMSKAEIETLLDGLLDAGYLEKTGDQYPVLQPASPLFQAVESGEKIMIRTDEEVVFAPVQTARTLNQGLYEHLVKTRWSMARAAGIPPYHIFNDKTLREMARLKPADKDQMLHVSGVGEVKLKVYGEAFLKAIQEYQNK